MEPFDSYPPPDGSRSAHLGSANCRHEYGLKLQQLTGQTKCAYCGMSLIKPYEYWLMMTMDHVVPRSAAQGLPEAWTENLHNVVLACVPCNAFCNRYRLDPDDPDLQPPKTFEEFLRLRDTVFERRKALILKRHALEREAWGKRRWEAR